MEPLQAQKQHQILVNPEEEVQNPFEEQIQEDQDYNEQEDDLPEDEEIDQDNQDADIDIIVQRKTRKKVKKNHDVNQSEDSSNMDDLFDQNVIMDKLPIDKNKLHDLLSQVKNKIRTYRQIFFNQQATLDSKKSHVGDNSVPICADITKFDFDKLIQTQLKIANREFDVLMMDPPWRLSTSQPSRGVAIQYQSLSDQLIEKIPVQKLQKSGFLFVWVINAKFQWTVNTMQKKWGYKVIDTINWIKKTVNGKIAKGHGFYLQHAKQTCLVGYKGDFQNYKGNVCCDVIFSDRRGQSQKPTQIYEYIEQLVPNGYYLQIFGRRNNLRQNWVTIGNEL